MPPRRLAAAEDVSAAIAALFSGPWSRTIKLLAQLAVFHEARFVQALTGARPGVCRRRAGQPSLLRSEFASGIGNGLPIHQEAGPRRWPPDSPQVPTFAAAGAGIFTGTPSGAAGFDIASLASEASAEICLRSKTRCNPKQSTFSAHCQRHTAMSWFFLATPHRRCFELAAGTDGQYTTYDGMSVVQITPAHQPVRGCHSRQRVYPAAVNLPLAQLLGDGLPKTGATSTKCRFTRWCRKGHCRDSSTGVASSLRKSRAATGASAWSGTPRAAASLWRPPVHGEPGQPSTVVHGVAVPVARCGDTSGSSQAWASNLAVNDRWSVRCMVAERSSADVCLFGLA